MTLSSFLFSQFSYHRTLPPASLSSVITSKPQSFRSFLPTLYPCTLSQPPTSISVCLELSPFHSTPSTLSLKLWGRRWADITREVEAHLTHKLLSLSSQWLFSCEWKRLWQGRGNIVFLPFPPPHLFHVHATRSECLIWSWDYLKWLQMTWLAKSVFLQPLRLSVADRYVSPNFRNINIVPYTHSKALSSRVQLAHKYMYVNQSKARQIETLKADS